MTNSCAKMQAAGQRNSFITATSAVATPKATLLVRQKRKFGHIAACLLLCFAALIMLPHGSGAEIIGDYDLKLLENTDHCATDCYSIYQVCLINPVTLKSTDVTFSFAKPFQKATTDSILQAKPIVNFSANGSCYKIRIDGKKKLFENIDNIPCFKGVCFESFAWWNSTFTKCNKISIVGTPNFPANYENEFKINNSVINYNNFTGNFIDVRFTNGTDCKTDSGTELNYWRHNGCDSTNTSANCSFFINMTTANMTTFLMYYGNPNATDVSNGFKTFHHFDDFNNGTTLNALWTKVETKGTVGVGGGFLNMNASINAGASGYCFDDEPQVKFDTSLTNFISEVDLVNFQPTQNYQKGLLVIYQNSTDCNAYEHEKTDVAPYERLFWSQRVALTNYTAGTATWSSPNVSFRMDYHNYNNDFYYSICPTCNSWILNGTTNRFFATTKTIKLATEAGGQPQTTITYWDNFRVRLYVANIPSWTMGSAETQPLVTCNYTFNIFDNVSGVQLTNVTLLSDFQNFTNVDSPFTSYNISLGEHNFSVSAIGYYWLNTSLNCQAENPVINMSIALGAIPPAPPAPTSNITNNYCCDWTEPTKSVCLNKTTLYQEYNETFCRNGVCEINAKYRTYNCDCVEGMNQYGAACNQPNYINILIVIGILMLLAVFITWASRR